MITSVRHAKGLLLAASCASVGCEALPRDGEPTFQTTVNERSVLGETPVATTSEAPASPRSSEQQAADEQAPAVPVEAFMPASQVAAPVDAGPPRPDPAISDPAISDPAISDAGSSESACSYPDYPATEWSPGAWVPVATSDAAELLAGVQAAMPGRWEGLATTPWTTPYRVEITFTADGHYSARCSELPSDCCNAFYYGSDNDTPIKRYRVDDATLSGNVFGEIDIAFAYGDEYGLPGWQGELSNIRRDASGNGLRFSFATSTGYGPIEYDLRRAPAGD